MSSGLLDYAVVNSSRIDILQQCIGTGYAFRSAVPDPNMFQHGLILHSMFQHSMSNHKIIT